MAMITAWMTASPHLMPAAMPGEQYHTALPSDSALKQEYTHLRTIAVELSLLCATALSCWADSIGVAREDLLKDIALGRAEPAPDPA
jgi:hypothetical protein